MLALVEVKHGSPLFEVDLRHPLPDRLDLAIACLVSLDDGGQFRVAASS